MQPADFGVVRGQVCKTGCRGIWLEAEMLERLDKTASGSGAALRAALMQRPHDHERSGVATCPAGHGPLTRQRHPEAPEVVIDVCDTCRGCFLDPGELGAIRRASSPPQPPSPPARRPVRTRYAGLDWLYALDFLLTCLD